MNKAITINHPYIIEIGDKARLCADITLEDKVNTLYFEVDNIYKDALCTERSDAFVSALLTTAMENSYDIICETPLSEQLYYQLTEYYMPIVSKHQPYVTEVKITAKLTSDKINSKNGVAVGASGGVDSFYSIIRHKDIDIEGRKITHLLFNNVCTLDNNDERIREWYNKKRKEIQIIADDFGLPLISMYTNMYSFYNFPYKTFSYFFAFTYAACVFALQNLISIYYQSAGFTLDDFDINTRNDAAYFDVFNLKCLSTESIVFYSAGTDKSRMEKVKFIADNRTVQKFLNVCPVEVSGNSNIKDNKINCGECPKCLRTLSELYALDKVDDFAESFSVEVFKRRTQHQLVKMYYLNSKAFSSDIINELKKQKKIKLTYYLWKCLYAPLYHIRSILKNYSVFRKLYYRLNIDILLYGFRNQSMYESYNKE